MADDNKCPLGKHDGVERDIKNIFKRLDTGDQTMKDLAKSIDAFKFWLAGTFIATLSSLVVGLILLVLRK